VEQVLEGDGKTMQSSDEPLVLIKMLIQHSGMCKGALESNLEQYAAALVQR